MSAEDIEDVIDHILAEVRFFVSCYGRTMADTSANSTTKTLSVSLYTSEPAPYSMMLQNFPPRILEACRQYKYDEGVKNDPIEYQRIYQELRIEAALVVVVSVEAILAAYAKVLCEACRTLPTPRSAPS